MPPLTNETSITSAQRAIPGFAQDPETRAWVAPYMLREPSPAQILRHSQSEIAKLHRLPAGWDGGDAAPISPVLGSAALSIVVNLTTRDGLATPQFSPSPDGGLNIIWLVNGDRLTASVERDEIGLYGIWADGQEAFRYERPWYAVLPHEYEAAINYGRTFLKKISINIQHQLMVP